MEDSVWYVFTTLNRINSTIYLQASELNQFWAPWLTVHLFGFVVPLLKVITEVFSSEVKGRCFYVRSYLLAFFLILHFLFSFWTLTSTHKGHWPQRWRFNCCTTVSPLLTDTPSWIFHISGGDRLKSTWKSNTTKERTFLRQYGHRKHGHCRNSKLGLEESSRQRGKLVQSSEKAVLVLGGEMGLLEKNSEIVDKGRKLVLFKVRWAPWKEGSCQCNPGAKWWWLIVTVSL